MLIPKVHQNLKNIARRRKPTSSLIELEFRFEETIFSYLSAELYSSSERQIISLSGTAFREREL